MNENRPRTETSNTIEEKKQMTFCDTCGSKRSIKSLESLFRRCIELSIYGGCKAVDESAERPP